jgi:hypothetical protein
MCVPTNTFLLLQLLVKDNLLLIEAICSSVLSHVEDEAEIILPELVRYMLSTQVATDIIVRLIRAEVLGAVEEGTILRGNEVRRTHARTHRHHGTH